MGVTRPAQTHLTGWRERPGPREGQYCVSYKGPGPWMVTLIFYREDLPPRLGSQLHAGGHELQVMIRGPCSCLPLNREEPGPGPPGPSQHQPLPNASVPSTDRVLAPSDTVFPQQKSSSSSKTQLNGPCSWKRPDSRGSSGTHFPWYRMNTSGVALAILASQQVGELRAGGACLYHPGVPAPRSALGLTASTGVSEPMCVCTCA